MPYKVVIKKCKDSHHAASVAEKIAQWSGVGKETVFNALVSKNLCIRIETDKDKALDLKNKFEAVGAPVRLIEYEETSIPTKKDTKQKSTEDQNKGVLFEEEKADLQQNVKTDIVIFAKKQKEEKREPDKKRRGKHRKKDRKAKKKKIDIEARDHDLCDLLITSEYRYEYIKELFRSLRTKILMGLHDLEDKSLVITSLEAGTGKSTIASNSAISIAQQNKKTILIDGDLKRGVLHEFFAKEQSLGLSDFLISEDEVTKDSVEALMKLTHVPNLSLITSGQNVDNSSELLTSERFLQLKKELSKYFEIIILDTPPLGALTDAIVINEIFSKYLIIVKAGATNVVDMKKKVNEYSALKDKVLGLVLNFAAVDKMRSYYARSKYYTEKVS